MLTSLTIQNYALIHSLEIKFDNGFGIITGETGAGKSILLGALGLILGQRADTSVLKDANANCVIEATFDVSKYDLKDFFDQNEIESEPSINIRRMITPAGKSRSFVNDNPINVSELKVLADRLVDVHSQHNNLLISNTSFQIGVIDAVAQNQSILQDYQENYKKYKTIHQQLTELKELAEKARQDADYMTHRFKVLDDAKLLNGEQEEMEAEQKTLSHTEEIKKNLDIVSQQLFGENISVVGYVKECLHALNSIKDFYAPAIEMIARLESCYEELKEIARDADKGSNAIDYNPDKLNNINQRLDLLYSLQQKFRVTGVNALIEERSKLFAALQAFNSYDERIETLNKELELQTEKLKKIASKLTLSRQNILPKLESEIVLMLQELGMPSATFKPVCNPLPIYTASGIDDITFLFSANKNVAAQEIAKVASGGEISRLMLCIKSMICKSIALPTIIFDEIDTGVSGDIADKMGEIMVQMSTYMQVISITHLPQIAAKGKYHYKVFKQEDDNSSFTSIKALNRDDRINEIAKMLSGKEISEAAIVNARELLK